jgi:FixJ family two-component response regulator
VDITRIDIQGFAVQPRPVVLIIDDDPAVRNSLKFSLEIEGYAVFLYPDGSDILGKFDLPHSDCLILDYNLPDMTGLEVLDQLRDRRIYAPAILITSHPNRILQERAEAAGARIVEKPLLGDALVESIRDVLGTRQLNC